MNYPKMINWLTNYLNNNGYYINNSGFYNYGYSYNECNYNNQQTGRAKRRRNRSKKKPTAKTYKNCLENVNSGTLPKTKNQKVKIENANGEKLCKKSVPFQLEGLATPNKIKVNKQNLISGQLQPAEKIKQIPGNGNPKKNKKQLQRAIALNKSEIKNTASKIQQGYGVNENKSEFSINNNITELILSLGDTFHEKFCAMQSRLVAEAALKPLHDEDDLIVAKIYIENNAISDDLIELIRIEIVGWIGLYQQQGMDTPIFHNLAKCDGYLTIVCHNKHAYECLERCIEDIFQTKTIGLLRILASPPITPLIYCFDATYEGIATDANLFLSQLHLHKPKLFSNDWLVASHKVCSEERRTYFTFLIDERSALALNFHYSTIFYVCMQQVTFYNRGVVTSPKKRGKKIN